MTYNAAFFDNLTRVSALSAARIVPLVLSAHPARSVIDVGCGRGAWLAEFAARGSAIRGIDGAYVSDLAIPRDAFEARDLLRPLPTGERYDLAVSLEVGEHLPGSRASGFVAELCAMADAVLFSAAIPGQGGTGHVNEQWPAYWADLFARHGYGCLDTVRPKVWSDRSIAWWFAQNTLIYVKGSPIVEPLALVHPELFTRKETLRMKLGALKARLLA